MLRSVFLITCLSLLPSAVAQSKFEYWPGTAYDPAVPTMRKVLGYDAGDRISTHANVGKYFEALAAAEPSRMKLFEYGKTWEGRKLIYAVIGNPENIRRISEVKSGLSQLADSRKTNDAAAKTRISNLPVVVWLAYGVHGNEISSTDAGLMTAYHLLAARNDKMISAILAKELIVIDPIQNPDGRDRFIHSFEMGEGLEPDPSPLAAEHTEPWPGGRTNHYFFDMNRDWVAITQPETKGRIAAMLEWHPQVVVDLHEMGTDASYYFAPPSDPYNPNMTKWQKDYQYDVGKGNAKWFDQFGFSYFTHDTYDAWYPGYGDSWPVYLGAIAMTYENGSTRGLIVNRPNGLTVTYRDTVRRHFVASIATCETSATNHDSLMQQFYDYGKTAVEEGIKGPVHEYVLPRRGNVTAVDKLAQLLVEQGVEVSRATQQFSLEGKDYPAGSYIVPMAQPGKRRITNLLDPSVSMDEKFLKNEDDRRARRLSSEIYDVTAWNVPLQFNIEAIAAAAAVPSGLTPVKFGDIPPGKVTGGKASVAYVVPWGTTAAARVLTGALRDNLRVYGYDKAFVQNGRTFPAGTLIVPVKENPERVHDTMTKLAAEHSAEVLAVNSSWVDDGPNFGSRYAPFIKRPAIALAWDRPTNAGSAGQTRFVLERQFNYPVTPIRTQQLSGAELDKFQVLILPDAAAGEGYADILGVGGLARLKQWVADGGTVIGLGSAVQFLADPRVGLLPIQQENRLGDTPAPATGVGGVAGAGGGRGGAGTGTAPVTPAAESARTAGKAFAKESDLLKAIQPDTEPPTSLHGALIRAVVDHEQWISSGVPDNVYAMVSGSNIFTPIKINRGVNAVVFAAPENLLASGYMWDEYRKQLAFKPLVVVGRSGRGVVIGFTADPNYRAAIDGLNMLFINAVFRGPAHTGAGGRGGE
jgi:hypothetical protein